jgi:hypothetical protein
MIAYFILVHRFPEQFKRMFRAIYDPTNHYLVHVDKRSGTAMLADIKGFLAPYMNANVLPAKPALWGGYSLVDAELRGMAALLQSGKNWTHFINLSGQDFPLKSQAFIRAHLTENPHTEYIRTLDQAVERPDTMNRLSHVCLELFGRIRRTRIARKMLTGVTPYIGNQWKIVSRDFCDYACHAQRAERIKRFYRKSFIPDEGFFQTLMMNGAPHGKIVSDDLRMIDWIPDGDIKLRPRTYTSADAQALLASPNLFARKFDMTEDPGIFAILERHIRAPRAIAQSSSRILQPVAAGSLAEANAARAKR